MPDAHQAVPLYKQWRNGIRERHMADLLVVGFFVGFFALALLLVKACERIVGAETELETVASEATTEPRAA